MANEIKKIQNRIYRFVSNFCGQLHHDDAWQNVGKLISMIKSVDGVNDVIVGAGVYHNYINKVDTNAGAYRDYETMVTTDFGNLYGYIRCHAAGTVQDEFDKYDMTISLYPDKKRDVQEKRIIISPKQLNEIMDNKKTTITFTGSNANELGQNAQEKYSDALRAGLNNNTISMQGKTTTNNASDKDEVNISFDTTKSNIKDSVTTAFQNAVSNGADPNKIAINGNSEDITNGVAESRSFTKRNVEIAILYEMKRNGKTMTKKQLTEELLGNDESVNIAELIGGLNVFEVLQAFSDVFGDDEVQRLSNSWDMKEAIIDMYNKATPEQQEKFVNILNNI